MRFSFTLVAAAIVASASARHLLPRQIPSCAGPCLLDVAKTTSSCDITDNGCLCKDDKFVAASTQCIVNTCKGDDLNNALEASKELCKAFGVTLTGTIPTPQSTGASAPATSSAPSSSGSATLTTPAPSSTQTSPSSAGSSSPSAPASSGSNTASAPAASQTGNGAMASGVSGAFAGLVAIGIAALAL